MNDVNMTYLNQEQITRLIDNRLFSSLDSVVSIIEVSLALLTIGLTIFLVITGLKSKRIVEIIEEMKDSVSAEINKKFYEESKIIEEGFQRKLTRNLRFYMKEYQQKAQKEEFIRNIMFKHLSELLANEIKINGEDNLKEVYVLYADRIYLIAQLTSNDEEQVKKALKKLSTGTYDKILRLEAFIDYLDILDKKTDMDIDLELSKVRNAILSNSNAKSYSEV